MSGPKALYEMFLANEGSYFDQLVDRVMETEIMDFKQLATDPVNGVFGKKEQALASEAIGGFYNTDGGVIVWGVDCRKNNAGEDVVVKLMPFPNLAKFKSDLYEYTNSATVPSIDGVTHETVASTSDPTKGFAVSYIPSGEGLPVQSMAKGLHRAIFYRSGNSFENMPHSMLADRFGRRPQPRLKLIAWGQVDTNGLQINFGLDNQGKGLAMSPAVMITSPFDLHMHGGSNMTFSHHHSMSDQLNLGNDLPRFIIPSASSLIIYPTCLHRVAYTVIQHSKRMDVFGVFNEGIDIKFTAYAEGCVSQGTLHLTDSLLEAGQRIYPI